MGKGIAINKQQLLKNVRKEKFYINYGTIYLIIVYPDTI